LRISNGFRGKTEIAFEIDLKEANMELTPLGREVAENFGEKLPTDRQVRLFHSPRNRCKETAEKIFQGFTKVNGKGIFMGESKSLHGIGINTQSYLDEFNKYKDYQVILRYLAGIYSPELWPPARPFYQRSGQQIWSQNESVSKGGIDIFISHDFHTYLKTYN